jgi:hypothetical protein
VLHIKPPGSTVLPDLACLFGWDWGNEKSHFDESEKSHSDENGKRHFHKKEKILPMCLLQRMDRLLTTPLNTWIWEA